MFGFLVWKVRSIHPVVLPAILVMLSMCSVGEKSLLTSTPRSRRELISAISWPSTWYGEVLRWALSPYLINSNLSLLKDMLLSTAQLVSLFRSACRVLASSRVVIALFILMSSANDDTFDWGTFLLISPIMIRKSRGPSTKPWGTLLLTPAVLDTAPLTLTDWVLPLRKLCSQTPTFPQIPSSLCLWRSNPWSTLSNPLAKSRYITSTFCPSFTFLMRYSWCFSSCDRHDLPLQNPCWPGFSLSPSSRSPGSSLVSSSQFFPVSLLCGKLRLLACSSWPGLWSPL